MELVEACASGNQRTALTALRDELAERLSTCKRADAVAPIARQLADVIARLDSLPDENRESATDELKAARAARRKKAASS